MGLTTKEPRREMYLVLADLITALGGYKVVAAACLVSVESVNKWKQNPVGNGQDIPVRHLQTLLACVGESLTNLAAQNAADELLADHFLNLCHRVAYPTEQVGQFIDMLAKQRPIAMEQRAG